MVAKHPTSAVSLMKPGRASHTGLVTLTPDSAVHTLRVIKLGVPRTERSDGEYSGFMESGERKFSAELTVM